MSDDVPQKAIWLARAERRVIELLHNQGAMIRREIEARVSDPPRGIHPHLLTTALQSLLASGEIVLSPPTRTRGKREVEVYHLPIVEGINKRLIEDASGRKRLLQARYLSWALPSSRRPGGLIGPAGNQALFAALTAPECVGTYALVREDGADVAQLFGAPVAGGALDSAALIVGRRGGVPVKAVTVIFEVKNIRHWIYPASVEVNQLLEKAALLQEANPDELIAPVLVCRRRHYWALEMAKDLGFFLIEKSMNNRCSGLLKSVTPSLTRCGTDSGMTP